jgi:hypothetical protein
MKKITKVLFCLVIWAMLICSINAQNAAKNWFFGIRARINFNGGTPTAMFVNTIATGEGSSSISDSNGNLLFYTDGVTVWDKNNSQMPNGFGLFGNSSSTHSALIVPCNCNKYFIFTTDAAENQYNNGLRYSVVDMSGNNGLGDVTSKNNPLLTPAVIARGSEKIAGISDGNGGFWVVGHTMGDNRFFSYHVLAGSNCTLNPQSDVTTKVSAVGSNYTGGNAGFGQGQMKISPDGTRLAVAGLNSIGTSFVELFQFDTTTGFVSNLPGGPIRDTSPYGFYGAEFSPDSKALYATTLYSANFLYRYNINANTLTNRTTINYFGGGNYIIGGLQLAPDGKIYLARYLSQFLNVLNSPNAVNGGWTTTPFNLATGSQSRLGLPTMVGGDFSCGQQGCCDQVKLTPFWTPDLSLAWKAFEVFNVKYPASDICSIDIDIRNSSSQPPPNPWNGGGLRVNNLPRAVPAWWKSPYVKIPNGTNGQTVIDGHPNFNSAAVNFNLGLDFSGTYTGKVKFIIRHCDGTICEWISENWTPTPPSVLKLSTNEIYLSDLKGEYLPMVIQFREAFAPGDAKWLAIEPLDEDTEVFSVDGGSREFYDENSEKTNQSPLVVASSRKQDKAALYEFAQAVSLERFEGGEIKLVLKRQAGNSNKPRLRFIFFDENANIIGYSTNEDSK